jgi:hypothetical protein
MSRGVDRRVRASEVLAGALAGVFGTAAMTMLMNPGPVGRLPPGWRPAEFVPKQIIEWMERTLGAPGVLSEDQEGLAAAAAHLGYGASMGALYGLVLGRRRRIPAPLAGALWGGLVWAAGYEGWLPAVGVRPATTEHPPREWPVPIANHLLYGITTALAFERLRRRGREG